MREAADSRRTTVPSVVADDRLIEALRNGTIMADDPDPLLRALARWRDDARREAVETWLGRGRRRLRGDRASGPG